IQDYILEYCNFGCPYFVVRRLSPNEFIEEIDDKEDIIDKLHDVKIQPTIQDTEKHTQAIDQ
ncbi:YutD-like domain-containing protein, partial [Staphylococcus saprophyticus]